MSHTRREFLKATAATSALASFAPVLPQFLLGSCAGKTAKGGAGDRVLVVVQLTGGNDGLNTVVPTHLQPYYDRRPTIGLTSGLLDLDGRYMLNSSLTGCKALWDLGELAVVNRVGYPNRNLSHFTSQREV